LENDIYSTPIEGNSLIVIDLGGSRLGT